MSSGVKGDEVMTIPDIKQIMQHLDSSPEQDIAIVGFPGVNLDSEMSRASESKVFFTENIDDGSLEAKKDVLMHRDAISSSFDDLHSKGWVLVSDDPKKTDIVFEDNVSQQSYFYRVFEFIMVILMRSVFTLIYITLCSLISYFTLTWFLNTFHYHVR